MRGRKQGALGGRKAVAGQGSYTCVWTMLPPPPLLPPLLPPLQACLIIYKLFGGNIAVGKPGDPANIFNFSGPQGIQVRHTAAACMTTRHTGTSRLH